jgi:hypothetical protein
MTLKLGSAWRTAIAAGETASATRIFMIFNPCGSYFLRASA